MDSKQVFDATLRTTEARARKALQDFDAAFRVMEAGLREAPHDEVCNVLVSLFSNNIGLLDRLLVRLEFDENKARAEECALFRKACSSRSIRTAQWFVHRFGFGPRDALSRNYQILYSYIMIPDGRGLLGWLVGDFCASPQALSSFCVGALATVCESCSDRAVRVFAVRLGLDTGDEQLPEGDPCLGSFLSKAHARITRHLLAAYRRVQCEDGTVSYAKNVAVHASRRYQRLLEVSAPRDEETTRMLLEWDQRL